MYSEDDFRDLEEGDVINADQQSTALIKRGMLPLADEKGEWLLPETLEEDALDKEEVESSEQELPDDLYASFAQRAARIPRLSEEEERELGLRVRDFHDEKAARQLVTHNMRLAIKMANQYRRAWTNLMDLVQEASAGMAIAAQRWDPDKGTRFGTYAAYWIRAQLTKFLMTNGRLIHTGTTRAGRKVYFNLPQIRRKLLLAGQEPTVERIAQEVGEDPKEVALIMSRLQGHEASLSSSAGEEGSQTLEDTLSGGDLGPEENAARFQMQRFMQDVIKRFEATLSDERDKAVWKEHLLAADPMSLVDLGKRYGVSKQRMGQLAVRLKRAFRRHIIDELGPHTQLSWLFNGDESIF